MARNEKLKSRIRESAKRRKDRVRRESSEDQQVLAVAKSDAAPDTAGIIVSACLEFEKLHGDLRDQEVLAALRGLMRDRQPQAGRGADLYEFLKKAGEEESVSLERLSTCADQIHAIARQHLSEENPHSLTQYFGLLR
ncbi:MAG: hypothetical protein AAF802_29210 [Planctomycetota bacterium]